MNGQFVLLETILQSMDMRSGIKKSSGYREILHFILQGKELMSLWTRGFGQKKNEKS